MKIVMLLGAALGAVAWSMGTGAVASVLLRSPLPPALIDADFPLERGEPQRFKLQPMPDLEECG